MKDKLHPEYHQNASIRCACGHKFTVGSTIAEMQVELCSNCHPFYTGKQKLIDTAGRVDRFKRLVEKKQTHRSKTLKKKTASAA